MKTRQQLIEQLEEVAARAQPGMERDDALVVRAFCEALVFLLHRE